jgi:ribulose-phosphate 3-epimerase
MTVEPGFGGQKFMSEQMSKVRVLREKFPQLNIQVDGGITIDNIEECATAGANAVVSGTGIIKQPDHSVIIAQMKEKVQKAIDTWKH